MAPRYSSTDSQEFTITPNPISAIDDLVPGDAESGIYGECIQARPHEAEIRAQRALLKIPQAEFSSLQVHRLKDGICLTGVVKVKEGTPRSHLTEVAATAAGVSEVLNRLFVQNGDAAP